MGPHRLTADFIQDLRFGIRNLRQNPGFAVLAVVSLALGIGASTAVFSIVQAVLLRPLPYRDPGRIVLVWDKVRHAEYAQQVFDSWSDFETFRRDSRTLADAAAFTWATGSKTLTGHGPAHYVLAIPVSDNFFRTLGVTAALGRTFQLDDLKRGCSVVLAHRFWEKELSGNPRVTGTALALDNKPCTVIGIMPAGFSFYPEATAMWMLITPDLLPAAPDQFIVGIAGRLRPGVTMAVAERELAAIHARLHEADKQERNIVPRLYPIQDEFTYLAGRNLRTTLLVLFGAVVLLLLIACVNVGNLLLSRAAAREREFAIRAALGSGKVRLMRQMLTEAFLLSAAGGVLGLMVAAAAVRWFNFVNPIELPPAAVVSVSVPVLLFGIVTASLTVVFAGLAPAVRASRTDLNTALKSAGRGLAGLIGRNALARGFIIAEMTLSLMLLAGAGLLMQSVLRMDNGAAAFDTDRITTMSVATAPGSAAGMPARREFFDTVLRRVSGIAGVRAAAFTSSLPAMGVGFDVLETEGRPRPSESAPRDVGAETISPDYFRVLRVPLLSGREFSAHDRADSAPVAIINTALAAKYFPHETALGHRIRIHDDRGKAPWRAIAGIVGNEKRTSVFEEMNWIEGPLFYVPLDQADLSGRSLTLALLTGPGDNGSLVNSVRRVIASVDAAAPVDDITTMRERISKYLAYPRFRAIVLSAFAAIALAMALVGLYGVLAQAVAQRAHEIGIRVALGATRRRVLGLVLRQSMTLVLPGIVAGVLLALVLTRFLGTLLYGVRAADVRTFALTVLAMILCAFAATVVPAGRALRVDPAETLREE